MKIFTRTRVKVDRDTNALVNNTTIDVLGGCVTDQLLWIESIHFIAAMIIVIRLLIKMDKVKSILKNKTKLEYVLFILMCVVYRLINKFIIVY